MSYSRKDIYRKRSERLNELMEKRNISNADLTDSNKNLPADADTFSPAYISMLRHNKKPLTEESGQRIINMVMPDVRLEYLMCYDDWETETYKNLALASQDSYDQDSRFHGLKLFLENYGYYMTKGTTFPLPKNASPEEAEQLVRDNTFYMICKGKDVIGDYTPDQFASLCDDIEQMISILIRRD